MAKIHTILENNFFAKKGFCRFLLAIWPVNDASIKNRCSKSMCIFCGFGSWLCSVWRCIRYCQINGCNWDILDICCWLSCNLVFSELGVNIGIYWAGSTLKDHGQMLTFYTSLGVLNKQVILWSWQMPWLLYFLPFLYSRNFTFSA